MLDDRIPEALTFDDVLLVPQRGEPVFATTLSKRVASRRSDSTRQTRTGASNPFTVCSPASSSWRIASGRRISSSATASTPTGRSTRCCGRARVQRAYLRSPGNVHHSVTDDGCRLQTCPARRINPLQLQVCDALYIDLIQRTVAVTTGQAIIRRPFAAFWIGHHLDIFWRY